MKNSDNITTCLGSLGFATNNMTISISMTKGAKASPLTVTVDDVFENANNSNTSEFYIKDR
jgi:hypothetical protein